MMSKKDYILKLLSMFQSREPAKGLKLLVEANEIDETTIDQLYNAFTTAVNEVRTETEKEKLGRGIQFLEKLKQIEIDEREQDEKDIIELDKMLKNV